MEILKNSSKILVTTEVNEEILIKNYKEEEIATLVDEATYELITNCYEPYYIIENLVLFTETYIWNDEYFKNKINNYLESLSDKIICDKSDCSDYCKLLEYQAKYEVLEYLFNNVNYEDFSKVYKNLCKSLLNTNCKTC